MNLYLLKRKDWGYDEYLGMLVRAPSATQARKIAADNAADEDPEQWLSPRLSTCEAVKVDGVPGFILGDFNAG